MVGPPGPWRFILGALFMLVGVVLPLGVAFLRNSRLRAPGLKQGRGA